MIDMAIANTMIRLSVAPKRPATSHLLLSLLRRRWARKREPSYKRDSEAGHWLPISGWNAHQMDLPLFYGPASKLDAIAGSPGVLSAALDETRMPILFADSREARKLVDPRTDDKVATH
jgi:hypothetical protein